MIDRAKTGEKVTGDEPDAELAEDPTDEPDDGAIPFEPFRAARQEERRQLASDDYGKAAFEADDQGRIKPRIIQTDPDDLIAYQKYLWREQAKTTAATSARMSASETAVSNWTPAPRSGSERANSERRTIEAAQLESAGRVRDFFTRSKTEPARNGDDRRAEPPASPPTPRSVWSWLKERFSTPKRSVWK